MTLIYDGWTFNSYDKWMWQEFLKIYSVRLFDAQSEMHTSDHFPCTVKQFLRLKDFSQSKKSENDLTDTLLTKHIVHQLMYLIWFYNIQGYEKWGINTDSFEEQCDFTRNWSRLLRLLLLLKMTLQSHSEIAHWVLTIQWEWRWVQSYQTGNQQSRQT